MKHHYIESENPIDHWDFLPVKDETVMERKRFFSDLGVNTIMF